MDEIFDVCDAHDRVIGQAPRAVVHAQKLLHRAAHIWVCDSAGRLLIHQRSAHKDESPLQWTSSASGHLGAGEDYQPAAVRELAEELGLHAELRQLVQLTATPELANEHTALFTGCTDQAPQPDPQEIAQIEYVTWAELTRRITAAPDSFSPPFLVLWRWAQATGWEPNTDSGKTCP